MPYISKVAGSLVTSSAATVTTFVGHLDDATNITIFITSSASQLSSGNTLKVAMWDFGDSTSLASGESFSTAFVPYNQYTTGVTPTLSSGNAYVLPGSVAFRSLRLGVLASGTNTDGEIVAWVMKQISV